MEKENAPLYLEILIDKSDKSVELSMEQLQQTRTFADAHGIMPAQFPMEHHVFINKICDMAKEHNAEPVVAQITAPIKGIERISETEAKAKDLNQNAADNTCIRTVIGRIDLGNKFARELWNLAIGFMYNEKGIELCIGTNISVCSNFTIWGEGKFYKNYGSGKIELSEMFTHVEEWLTTLEGIELANSELLERMDKCAIDYEKDTLQFIGHCLREAVRMNYFRGGPFVLNQGQAGKIASYFLSKEQEIDFNEREPSLYDIYNAGTYVLTHVEDPRDKFSNIKNFTDWFVENYLEPFEESLKEGAKDDPVGSAFTGEEFDGNKLREERKGSNKEEENLDENKESDDESDPETDNKNPSRRS